jgi:tetratricopeptide (TPR) repeat protein
VGVDELKRRDAQRQTRFWASIAIGSIFITTLTIGLAVYALYAKRESEIRRQQAENLIGFMLGDLRKNLEPIGKLELLDSVGDQAMKYFATLGNRGSPKELLDRAKALKQIGEVRKAQGELEPALRAFKQALLQSEALYKTDPSNNDYLFELGQAEFWVGYVAWERGDLKSAEPYFQNYMQYSRELLKREPDNSDYNMELSYAYSNLGSLARARGNSQVALDNFILSAEINAAELRKTPDNIDLIFNYAEGLSWIGSTKADLGDLKGSEQAFAEISTLLNPIYEKAENAKLTHTLAANMGFQTEAKLNLGDTNSAKALNAKSHSILVMLVAKDPQNAAWLDTYNKSVLIKLSMIPASDWSASNDAELNQLQESTRKLLMLDSSNSTNTIRLASLLREKALRALHTGNAIDAITYAKSAHTLMLDLVKKSDSKPMLLVHLAKSAEVLGSALTANQQTQAAEVIWNDTANLLDKQSIRIFDFYPVRYLLAIDLKQTDIAKQIETELTKAFYKDSRMDPAYTLSGSFR